MPALPLASFLRAALAATLVLLPSAAQAQDGGSGFDKRGTTGLAVLELPLTPRTAGGGDVRSVGSSGADGLLANPALAALPGSPRTQVHASGASYVFGSRLASLAVAHRLGGAGTVGVSVGHVDYGEMDRSVVGSLPSGTFGARETFVGLTYGRALSDRFAFGVTAKAVRGQIDTYTASAVAVDVGMAYDTGLGSLRLGGLMQNFGQEARYEEEPFRLPTTFRLGAAYDVLPAAHRLGRVTARLEALHPNNGPEEVHASLEATPLPSVALRGGYAFGRDEGGLALGGSLSLADGRLTVDVGYAGMGRLGSTLGVGLRSAF